MNKNYFSDITDLFLKVKKEENIQIDESAKANIRKMLQAKIGEMKAGDTYEKLEPLAPEKSFWSMWKNQLIGVPASLAAIALVVYAASNINVSIPKEDFSPKRDTQTNITQVEPEETTQTTEFDRPLVKTAEGTLVIDYSEDEREARSLNQIKSIPKETTTEKVVFETPEIDYSDQATFILDEKEEDSKEPVEEEIKEQEDSVKEEESKNEPEKNEAELEAEEILPITETTTVQEEAEENIKEPEERVTITDSLDADIPLDEAERTTAIIDATQDIVTANNIAELAEPAYFPVYTYKDEDLKKEAAFTEEKLAKLTRSKTPESVTVYYVEDRQVVVEIEEKGITKWYLFDNVDGTWTISRYEKYVTESVVE